MVKNLVASLVAAVVLFLWGGIYWAANPYAKKVVRPIPDEAKVALTLAATLPESGLYALPTESQSPDTLAARLDKGPVATIHWRRESGTNQTSTMIRGFLVGWLVCAVLLAILAQAAPALPRFGQRWFLASLVGLLVALQTSYAGAIWWYRGADWAWLDGVYQTVGLSLAGAVLAAFTRPRP